MTTPDQILRDLLTSDSTTDALAERMRPLARSQPTPGTCENKPNEN